LLDSLLQEIKCDINYGVTSSITDARSQDQVPIVRMIPEQVIHEGDDRRLQLRLKKGWDAAQISHLHRN